MEQLPDLRGVTNGPGRATTIRSKHMDEIKPDNIMAAPWHEGEAPGQIAHTLTSADAAP
jgi:hypothetical protein